MTLESIRKHILSCLTRAAESETAKSGSGCRTAREIADWIGSYILTPDVNRVDQINRLLQKLEEEGLVERVGKLGNAIYWNLRLPVQKNTLVVIGYMGVKRAYLNMSEEDALREHLEAEWPEGWDEATETETRKLMKSFEFSDRFSVYDASGS
jgi:hypothetical protein